VVYRYSNVACIQATQFYFLEEISEAIPCTCRGFQFSQALRAPKWLCRTPTRAFRAAAPASTHFIRDSGNARAGQLLISTSQLGSISVGSQITGFSFRLYNGNLTGFPASTATWADYTVNMGVGVALGSQSTTFASNFVGAPTLVRSGALVVNAGAYTAGATGTTPNPFGPSITFNTPYTYTGGNLLIEIRHTGSNILNGTTDFLDALPTTVTGYGTDFWSATATGNTATVWSGQ